MEKQLVSPANCLAKQMDLENHPQDRQFEGETPMPSMTSFECSAQEQGRQESIMALEERIIGNLAT